MNPPTHPLLFIVIGLGAKDVTYQLSTVRCLLAKVRFDVFGPVWVCHMDTAPKVAQSTAFSGVDGELFLPKRRFESLVFAISLGALLPIMRSNRSVRPGTAQLGVETAGESY